MRVRTYNNLMRDFFTVADALQRRAAYDYAVSGGSTEAAARPAQSVSLPLDVLAGDNAFTITAYVPGVNPDEVEITIEGEELTIRGTLPNVEENATFIKRELYHGSFERRLAFNVPVNADAIEAHFSNGLLTLTVPKAEVARPKQIKVQTV
jgi:HSP20 family protein